jgi:hypothetical protein
MTDVNTTISNVPFSHNDGNDVGGHDVIHLQQQQMDNFHQQGRGSCTVDLSNNQNDYASSDSSDSPSSSSPLVQLLASHRALLLAVSVEPLGMQVANSLAKLMAEVRTSGELSHKKTQLPKYDNASMSFGNASSNRDNRNRPEAPAAADGSSSHPYFTASTVASYSGTAKEALLYVLEMEELSQDVGVLGNSLRPSSSSVVARGLSGTNSTLNAEDDQQCHNSNIGPLLVRLCASDPSW